MFVIALLRVSLSFQNALVCLSAETYPTVVYLEGYRGVWATWEMLAICEFTTQSFGFHSLEILEHIRVYVCYIFISLVPLQVFIL